MPIGTACQRKYVSIKTKQTGKGAELIYAVDQNGNTTKIMTIGNKTGHVFLFDKIPSSIFTDVDYKGRVKVVATQGKARRC